jgi:hypothetical protein
MKKLRTELICKHKNKACYLYKLKDNDINLCNKCNKDLLAQMKEQEEFEIAMLPLVIKLKKIK